MKTPWILALLVVVSTAALAQEPPSRARRAMVIEVQLESLLNQAVQSFGQIKRTYQRDMEVLDHLQRADQGLLDTMQPSAALEEAWEHVEAAKSLEPEFLVNQGVIRISHELENARRSPHSTDFSRLHVLLEREATGPARRLVARNALEIQEETVTWLKAQERIAGHLRELSTLATESLRRTTLEE